MAMNKKRTTLVVGLTLLLISLLGAGLAGMSLRANASGNAHGSAGAMHTAGKVRNFTLYIRGVYLKLPNGQKSFMFGYTDNPNTPASIPGPTLVVDEGDTVNVTLTDDQ